MMLLESQEKNKDKSWAVSKTIKSRKNLFYLAEKRVVA